MKQKAWKKKKKGRLKLKSRKDGWCNWGKGHPGGSYKNF